MLFLLNNFSDTSDIFSMNELKKRMIETARRRHNRIFPCASFLNLEDSFTVEGQKLIFWYNTEDHSTHLVVETLC